MSRPPFLQGEGVGSVLDPQRGRSRGGRCDVEVTRYPGNFYTSPDCPTTQRKPPETSAIDLTELSTLGGAHRDVAAVSASALLREDILVADQPVCLCIVSRDRLRGSDFIAALGASLRPQEHLEIIVDRRSGEHSDEWDAAEDRRHRPQVDLALKANGFAIVPAPGPKGERTPLSLLLPSAPSSRLAPEYDDDEARLEAIRSFKRERSSNLVPWLVAALAVVAAAAFVLSPTGQALKQDLTYRSSPGATGSSSPPTTPNPADAPSAKAPAVAEKSSVVDGPTPADIPARADTPTRVPGTEAPPVDRPLRGRASTDAAGTGAVASPGDAGAPPAESTIPPRAAPSPSTGRRSRSTETPRPSSSAPVPQATVVPAPPEPVSRAVSPRFAGLPRVELSREPSSAGGTYAVRIVDPAGKLLPDAEVLLLARMPDGTVENVRMDFYPDRGAYRGSLATTHSSPVDLRVRVITGDKRVEIPLGP
jgi:hypothetical protein